MTLKRIRQHKRTIRLRSGKTVTFSVKEHGRRAEGGEGHRLSSLPTFPAWQREMLDRLERETELQGARDQGVYQDYIPPEDWAATSYMDTQRVLLHRRARGQL